MTRMESRVDKLEAEMVVVREKVEGMETKLGEINQEMVAKMGDLNNRMESLEANMEIIKGYLCDLKKATVAKEGDKGKAPMSHKAFPSYSLLERGTTILLSARNEQTVGEEKDTYRR